MVAVNSRLRGSRFAAHQGPIHRPTLCATTCVSKDVVLRNSGSESAGTPLCSSSEAFQNANPPSSKQNLRELEKLKTDGREMLASLLAVAAWTTPIVSHPGLVTHSGLGKHSGSARVQRCSEPRAEYGDKYYSGATGPLPENVFEVVLPTPLGIQFEENDYPKKGVSVVGLVPDSNAAKSGLIAVGDYLVGVTAIQFQGAKWERRMLDCRKWDFDTVVDAIKSNKPQFSCDDVILQFYRTS